MVMPCNEGLSIGLTLPAEIFADLNLVKCN